ncbi:MAG: PhzF family isomerase [Rhodobacteraceae bacterium]|nr:PhzF family isomerase [Paracoccaceae bacterium]
MTIVHVVDAFTSTPGEGNRAGVVLDADHLSDIEMQAIAAFAGYSETAFVLTAKSDEHDIHVRYFTPAHEVPICGHATISTHFLRAAQANDADYEVRALTGAGTLPVTVKNSGAEALVTMTQGAVKYQDILSDRQIETLIQGLRIRPEDLVLDLPVQIVTTGHSKVMVPLTSQATINHLNPDYEILSALSREIGCNGFFAFSIDGNEEQIETNGRMFAPAIGIQEDPVTGNANGPAGAYLWNYGYLPKHRETTYPGHQGKAMGKPGTIFVTVTPPDTPSANAAPSISIAGQAVIVGERPYQD